MSWSIITVAKGLWPVTQQCLQSMYEHLPQDQQYEVVYIDNGSPEGESGANQYLEWMLEHQDRFMPPVMKVIPPIKREFYRGPAFDYGVGLSTAWNMAVRLSHCDKLLFVNNDISFTGGDWLPAFEIKLHDPQCAVVGVRSMSWHNVAFNQGSLFALRRDVYDKVGPFDERMEFSCEEVDFQYRTIQMGYNNPTCEWLASKAHHEDGVTRRHYRDAEWYMLFLAHQSRLLFCYKWPELGQPSITD